MESPSLRTDLANALILAFYEGKVKICLLKKSWPIHFTSYWNIFHKVTFRKVETQYIEEELKLIYEFLE